MRVATHLGYCAGIAGRTYEDTAADNATWVQADADIKEDLLEAVAHMQSPPDMSPFLPQEVIDEFANIRNDIETLREATATQEEIFEALQILNHNAAYVAARYEHFTTGAEVTEGTQA
jgi:hypothetical protein